MFNAFVETDVAGWPLGVLPETRTWLLNKLPEILKRPNKDGWTLHEIVYWIYHEATLPLQLKEAILQDWRFAVIERALRAIKARQVYTL